MYKKKILYSSIHTYFNDPYMLKISNDIYISQIDSIFSRYIIAVKNDNTPIGNYKKLSIIEWTRFSTKTITNFFQLKKHTYDYNKGYELLVSKIYLDTSQNNYIKKYNCFDYPIEIKLYSTNNVLLEGTLRNALETYQTDIIFI